MKKPNYKILRMRDVMDTTSYPRSTVYQKVNAGLLTRAVSLGGRNKGWPEDEIHAINAARIAGKSDDFVRCLVKHLEAQRLCDHSDLLQDIAPHKQEGQ
jgi:prophage regulatory protein